jgi:hypothetical protein
MHFHELARCLSCQDFEQFATPIPQILILSHPCSRCGAVAMVGYTGVEFMAPGSPCQECFVAQASAEHFPTDFPPTHT